MAVNYINKLKKALDNNDLKNIKVCLEHIKDINVNLIKGRSVLTYSPEQNLEVAKYLIENGANINAKADDGLTPLIWHTLHRHYAIVELLVEKGADITSKDNFGKNALYYLDLCNNTWCPYHKKMVSLLGGTP